MATQVDFTPIFESREYKLALERAEKPAQFPYRVRKAAYQRKTYTKWDAAIDRLREAYTTKLQGEYTRLRLKEAKTELEGQLSLLEDDGFAPEPDPDQAYERWLERGDHETERDLAEHDAMYGPGGEYDGLYNRCSQPDDELPF
jgi:hypothetical protein